MEPQSVRKFWDSARPFGSVSLVTNNREASVGKVPSQLMLSPRLQFKLYKAESLIAVKDFAVGVRRQVTPASTVFERVVELKLSLFRLAGNKSDVVLAAVLRGHPRRDFRARFFARPTEHNTRSGLVDSMGGAQVSRVALGGLNPRNKVRAVLVVRVNRHP